MTFTVNCMFIERCTKQSGEDCINCGFPKIICLSDKIRDELNDNPLYVYNGLRVDDQETLMFYLNLLENYGAMLYYKQTVFQYLYINDLQIHSFDQSTYIQLFRIDKSKHKDKGEIFCLFRNCNDFYKYLTDRGYRQNSSMQMKFVD